MSLKTRKFIAVWFLNVFLIFATVAGAHAYSSILAFGDSLSDNGTYGQYADAAAYTSPSDLYGFQRFSNGPVWVEYLAQDLGVSIRDAAFGGATTSWDNPAANLSYTGLQWQVANLAGPISSDTLVTVWAGGNDMFNGRDPATAASNIATAIQSLIALGGRSFIVPNLSIVGPLAAWMTVFDTALASQLSALIQQYNYVDFYGLDLNALVLTGIDYTTTGTWKNNSCANNPDDPNCLNGTFAWWDTVYVHPTTQVHEQIAAYAASKVPEPASIIFLIIGFAGLVGARRMK